MWLVIVRFWARRRRGTGFHKAARSKGSTDANTCCHHRSGCGPIRRRVWQQRVDYRYDDHDDHDDDNFTVENIHDDVLAHTTIDAKSSTGARFCTFVCATTNDQSA